MLERFQERLNRRLPQRTPIGSPEQPMPVAAEGGQRNVFRPTARANESTGHLARQIRREKRIVGRIEPQRGNAGGRAITRRPRRPGAAARSCRLCGCPPPRPPAKLMTANTPGGFWLAAASDPQPPADQPIRRIRSRCTSVSTTEIVDRRSDVLGRGHPGPIVVGAAARSEVFQPGTAGLPIAATQRQRDHVSALRGASSIPRKTSVSPCSDAGKRRRASHG